MQAFHQITSLRFNFFLIFNLFSFLLPMMNKNEYDVLRVYWARTSKQSVLLLSETHNAIPQGIVRQKQNSFSL